MNYLNKKRRNFIIYMVVVIVLIFAVFNTVLTFKIHNQLEKMAQNPGRWPAGAYVYDPGIGFDFSPNISGYISDSSYYVKSHKFGYRIAENDDPDTYQSGGVLSLGCSVTYGDEVESDQTFTQLIADSLGLPAYNYGVSSFSYIHALVKAQKLNDNGILDTLRPSIVVLGCWRGLTNRSRTPFPPIASKNIPLTAAFITKNDDGIMIKYPISTQQVFELATLYRKDGPNLSIKKFIKIFAAVPKFVYVFVKNKMTYGNARGIISNNKVSDYELYDFYFTGIENIFSNKTKIIVLHMPTKLNDRPNDELLKAIADHTNIIFVDGESAIKKYNVSTSEYQGKHPQPEAHMAYAKETLNRLK